MQYDYTEAPPPRDLELIPHGTIATVVMQIRAGDVGEDGLLKRSKDGGCEMLDLEFTVVDGPHKGRKFWELWILTGTTDGHAGAPRSIAARCKPSSIARSDQTRRYESPGAHGPHGQPEANRREDLHCQNRYRKGQGQERRLERKLARQKHSRRRDHAR